MSVAERKLTRELIEIDESKQTELKLVFQQSSAHLLSRSAPSVAAHICKTFIQTAKSNEIVLPSQLLRSSCGVCNSVWIPGYNLLVLSRKRRKLKNAARTAKLINWRTDTVADKGSELCYICLACEKVTRFAYSDMDSKLEVMDEKPTNGRQIPESVLNISSETEGKTTSGQSSRKRQKLRKQNTLQMMLAKSRAEKVAKSTNPGPSGINLMDMMKSSDK
ncbi:uncharacterized protein V1516DRAFT_684618 [Lipomyces oligophaga]|uniref:uncharacterized protein n=1 Tax=Lipomyces oligophaga TaxID=45792 RepID=UPI0034CDCE9D